MAALLCGAAIGHAMTYEYDANGHLRSATNSLGETATYDYDSRGNLLRITRANGALGINSFSPGYGEPGIEVAIRGAGFSSTPVNNDVKFNGTAAAVLSATVTEMIVMVPVGATDGPISVTVGANTATSTDGFDVTDTGLPPVITSFTPATGAAGTSVTIGGTNLQPYPGRTTVEVNGMYMPITSISDVSITFVVPLWAGSGYVTVTTPYGQDIGGLLSVAPAAQYPNVTQYASISTSSSASISLATSKHAVLTFDAGEGDYITLHTSSWSGTATSATYTLYSPAGTILDTGLIRTTTTSAHFPQLRRSGTYTVVISPGANTLSITAILERDAEFEIGGSPVSGSRAASYQEKRLLFKANAGDRVGLGFTGVTNSPSFWVNSPDGVRLEETTCATGMCDLNVVDLPETGTYELIVFKGATGTFDYTVTASEDLDGSLADNTPLSISLTRNGQNQRVSFSGTAGQVAALRLYDISTTPSGKEVTVFVYKPDGSSYVNASQTNGGVINLRALPASGTYTALIDPDYGETGTMKLELMTGGGYTITADGSALNQSTSSNWQPLFFSFDGTAGENLGLALSGITKSSGSAISVSTYKPNGTVVSGGSNSSCAVSTGCDFKLALVNLAATGTYTVIVYPGSAATMAYTATLSHENTDTLTANTPLSVSVSRTGQNSRVSFSGTAGMAAGLQWYGVSTTPSSRAVNVYAIKPDGTTLKSDFSATGDTLNLWNLPVTGTYTAVINGDNGATSSVTLNLATGSGIEIAVDGSAYAASSSTTGQMPFLTFAGTSGENLGIGITGVSLGSGTTLAYSIGRPNSTSYLTTGSCTVSANGCDAELENLPATGTYSITLGPPAAASSMSASVTVSHEVTGTLVTSVSQGITISRRGQDARYTFSGTSGTSPSLTLSSISTTPSGKTIAFKVLKPDGSTWKTASASSSTTINLTSMPATGTYTLVADPGSGASASFNALLQ